MVKPSKNQMALAIIAVIAVPVIALGVNQAIDGPLPQFNLNSQTCGVSADEVTFFSNDPDLNNEKAWKVELRAPCGDEIMTGGALVPKDNIKGTDSNGKTVQARRDFSLAIQNFKSWAEQDIQKDKINTIYEVQTYEQVNNGDTIQCQQLTGGCGSDAQNTCESFQTTNPDYQHNGLEISVEDAAAGGGRLWCTRAVKVGEVHDQLPTSTTTGFEATAKIRAAGETKSTTINKETGAATVGAGDQKALVDWAGSLRGDIIDVNFPSGYVPVCDNDCRNPETDVSWKFSTESIRKDYANTVINFESNFRDAVNSGSDPTTYVRGLNDDSNNLRVDQKQALKNDIGSWVQNINVVDGKLRIIPQNPGTLEIASFIVRVDADWIGFFVPKVKPSIGNVPDQSVTAQSSTQVDVPITNTADYNGSIQVSLSCGSPLDGGSTTLHDMNPDETRTPTLTIDAGASAGQTVTCTVVAFDDDFPDQTRVTKDFGVEVKSSCVDSDSDGVCNEFDVCQNTKGPESNNGCPTKELKCSDGLDNDGDGAVDGDDPDCENPPDDTDGDGIVDSDDQCPTQPENYDNGFENNDGCPDKRPGQEICDNGIDDDGDRLIDTRDPDCESPPETPWKLIAAVVLILGISAIFRKQIGEAIGGS